MRFLDTRITRALSTMLVVISSLSQDLVLESNSYRDTAPRVQHFSAFHYYRDGGGGLALSVYNRFHLQLAVKWTHIYITVTIPSKLRLVKKMVYF